MHAKAISSSVKAPNKRLRSILPVASPEPEDPCSLHCDLAMGNCPHRAGRYPSRTLVYGCWKTAQKHATLRHVSGNPARLPDGKHQSVSRFAVIRSDLRFVSPGQRENLWRKRPGTGHIRQGAMFSIVSRGSFIRMACRSTHLPDPYLHNGRLRTTGNRRYIAISQQRTLVDKRWNLLEKRPPVATLSHGAGGSPSARIDWQVLSR
jgi:hypothetical protein